MQSPLQITFRGLASSPSLETRVREKATKLERLFGRITSCHVVIEAPHEHHKGGTYSVAIDVTIPDGKLVVGRDDGRDPAHQDPYVAVRDAFDALARRLHDRVRRQRGHVKHHGPS